MKDNFSTQANEYAKYRPTYPNELFNYLLSLTTEKECLWDCATGNGQVAGELAAHFKHVYATDISEAQIQNAVRLPNISYSIQSAEKTDFGDKTFDLIVVAQAIHWFNFDNFYKEVKRTLKSNGLLAVAGYNLLQISNEVDVVVKQFKTEYIAEYWDAERRYIDEGYQTIPFPFDEIEAPEFSISLQWTFDHLIGYLDTWSAVKHFEKQKGINPVQQYKNKLKTAWGNEETKLVTFPILLRVGRSIVNADL
jgi:SAM-dependent methyltransferase